MLGEYISYNLIRYNYCNVNYVAQLNITTSIKMTHQFHLKSTSAILTKKKSTSAMLLTEAASVKLSRLKKILNFFSPLPHASLSLSETQKRKQATKSEAQSEIWISFPLSSSRLSLLEIELDLKLDFKPLGIFINLWVCIFCFLVCK